MGSADMLRMIEAASTFLDQPLSDDAYCQLRKKTCLEAVTRALMSDDLSDKDFSLLTDGASRALQLRNGVQDFLNIDPAQGSFGARLVKEAREGHIPINNFFCTSLHYIIIGVFEPCTTQISDENFSKMFKLGLFDLLVVLVAHQDLGVATRANQIITELVKTSSQNVADYLCGEFVFKVKHITEACNDCEHKLRLYEFFVTFGKSNEANFKACQDVYKELIALYIGDDLLVKLNVVELVADLGNSPNGIDFLIQQNMFGLLLMDLLPSSELDDSGRIPILSVVADMISVHESLEKNVLDNSILLEVITEFFDSPRSDPDSCSKQVAAMQAWGSLAQHSWGRNLLSSKKDLLNRVVDNLGDTSSSKVSLGAMDSLAHFIAAYKNEADVSEWVVLGLKVKILPTIFDIITRRPFGETRTHAYRLLSICSRYRFAVETIVQREDIMEIVLNYLSDSDLEAKYAKHELVSNILTIHKEVVETSLSCEQYTYLVQFGEAGPCFVPPGTVVSVDTEASM